MPPSDNPQSATALEVPGDSSGQNILSEVYHNAVDAVTKYPTATVVTLLAAGGAAAAVYLTRGRALAGAAEETLGATSTGTLNLADDAVLGKQLEISWGSPVPAFASRSSGGKNLLGWIEEHSRLASHEPFRIDSLGGKLDRALISHSNRLNLAPLIETRSQTVASSISNSANEFVPYRARPGSELIGPNRVTLRRNGLLKSVPNWPK